jgi:hypothetical protein
MAVGSWIREHFITWVIPALEHRIKTPETPALSRDVKYVPSPIKPEGDGAYTFELRLLQAWVNMHCGVLPMEEPKLNNHGGIRPPIGQGWTRVRNSLKSAWAYAKKVRPQPVLLLAGRDVWVYEVLAHRYGMNSRFIPEISRNVASNHTALLTLCREHGINGTEILFDTGFYGSVPKAFAAALKQPVDFLLLSQDRVYTPYGDDPTKNPLGKQHPTPNQVFPSMKGSRSLALWVEYLPKYWKSGRVETNEVRQELAEPNEIVEAAILTSCIWRGFNWREARQMVWGNRLRNPLTATTTTTNNYQFAWNSPWVNGNGVK